MMMIKWEVIEDVSNKLEEEFIDFSGVFNINKRRRRKLKWFWVNGSIDKYGVMLRECFLEVKEDKYRFRSVKF